MTERDQLLWPFTAGRRGTEQQTQHNLSAVTDLAATAGGRVQIEIRPGWREPVNLYTVIVAHPGERKSAVLDTMTGPLIEAEQALADAGRAERVEL